MSSGSSIDGVLVQWGDRLFYPANRVLKSAVTPRLDTGIRQRAAVIRQRLTATVARRAPQVMVKVTGGGRGMAAIAAHLRYISKNGRLAFEDDRGIAREGKEALHDLVNQWRFGGSLIEELGHRREAFNLMLSMPCGTDAQLLLKAVREFARTELSGHRYAMVLHEHQANPHVHLSVRAESMRGERLSPRKADLHRWRETFAEKLRGWGIDAEATRQATRGANRHFDPLWRLKARAEGRLRSAGSPVKDGEAYHASRRGAVEAWSHLMDALEASPLPDDRQLAAGIARFVRDSAFIREEMQRRRIREAALSRDHRTNPELTRTRSVDRSGPQRGR